MTKTWRDIAVTRETEVTGVLIPDMAEMSDEAYRAYARDGLVYTDHNWVLRSTPADYPIATTNRQLDILIEELELYRGKLNDR